jgi:hypothetical protein
MRQMEQLNREQRSFGRSMRLSNLPMNVRMITFDSKLKMIPPRCLCVPLAGHLISTGLYWLTRNVDPK